MRDQLTFGVYQRPRFIGCTGPADERYLMEKQTGMCRRSYIYISDSALRSVISPSSSPSRGFACCQAFTVNKNLFLMIK